MSKPMDDRQVRSYLGAFADGELDVEQNIRVLEHMSMHPEAARRVMHTQQLRQLVDRALRESGVATPEGLKAAVAELMEAGPRAEGRGPRGEAEEEVAEWPSGQVAERGHLTPVTSAPTSHITHHTSHIRAEGRGPRAEGSNGVLARVWRWAPAAVAAVLMLVAALLYTASLDAARPLPEEESGSMTGIIPVSMAERFAGRHVRCTRMISRVRTVAELAKPIEALPGPLSEYLGASVAPGLDLSSIGYEFREVGRCTIPGEPGAHLIYQPIGYRGEGERGDMLSLWIAPYRGTPEIEPDRLYHATQPGAAHPILLWRQQRTIYYIVGDELQAAERAAAALQQQQAPSL